MNIFYLSKDPAECASYHCDKHVVKMCIEYAQLLSTAHFILDGVQVGYKPTHKNHPSAIWTRETSENYRWLYSLWRELGLEFTIRYGKQHKSLLTLQDKLNKLPCNIRVGDCTAIPQCMPDDCKSDDSVTAYRNYYLKHKFDICKWKLGNVPSWFEGK